MFDSNVFEGRNAFYKEVAPLADKLFGTADLGKLLGMRRQIINYFIKEGRFPNHTTVGRSYAVPASDALKFARDEIKKRREEKLSLDAEIETLEQAERELKAIVAK